MKKEIMMDPQLAMQEAERFVMDACEGGYTDNLSKLTSKLRWAYAYGEKEEADELEEEIKEYCKDFNEYSLVEGE